MESKTPYKVKAAGNITFGILGIIFDCISLCMFYDALTGYKRIDNVLNKVIFFTWFFLAISVFCFFYGCYLVSKAKAQDSGEQDSVRFWSKKKYNNHAIVLAVCGVVLIIIMLLMCYVKDELILYLPDKLFFPVYIAPACELCIYCFIVAIIFAEFALDEPETRDKPIEYNNNFWAKFSSNSNLNSGVGKNNFSNKGSASTTFWLCPKCGRENANYVGTCGCGERQEALKSAYNVPEESNPITVSPVFGYAVISSATDKPEKTSSQAGAQSENTGSGDKFCPYCGKVVKEKYVFCGDCSKKLD